MKTILSLLTCFLVLLIISCSIKRNDKQEGSSLIARESAAINASLLNNLAYNDTAITYDLEGLSTEGGEAKAFYHNDKLYKCEATVFGGSGQTELFYLVSNGTITVTEIRFKYTVPKEMLSCPAEIQATDTLRYHFDKTGKMVSTTPGKYDLALYRAIIKRVPFAFWNGCIAMHLDEE